MSRPRKPLIAMTARDPSRPPMSIGSIAEIMEARPAKGAIRASPVVFRIRHAPLRRRLARFLASEQARVGYRITITEVAERLLTEALDAKEAR